MFMIETRKWCRRYLWWDTEKASTLFMVRHENGVVVIYAGDMKADVIKLC